MSADDDGPDDADRFFVSLLRDINRDIARDLLRGSDVQCFSTEQYFEARSKFLRVRLKIGLHDEPKYFSMKNARDQLQASASGNAVKDCG